MNSAACLQWLSLELNRQAEAYDLYHAGKLLYQTGRYLGAAKLLQLYVDGPGNELPGHHLLGYAYYHVEERRKALYEIKKVVNSQSTNARSQLHAADLAIPHSHSLAFSVSADGFDADWQLLIELQVDLDRADGLLPPPADTIPQTPM